MKLRAEISIGPYSTGFDLDTDKLDRNYEDEDYAYWIVQDYRGYVHEVTIDKDNDGRFLFTGRDYVWFDLGDFEDGRDADKSFPIEFKVQQNKEYGTTE